MKTDDNVIIEPPGCIRFAESELAYEIHEILCGQVTLTYGSIAANHASATATASIPAATLTTRANQVSNLAWDVFLQPITQADGVCIEIGEISSEGVLMATASNHSTAAVNTGARTVSYLAIRSKRATD
jgi:hypothetical protein